MKENSHDPLQKMRHSCAHLFAYAVRELYPDVQLTIGPAIDNGFYYDIDIVKPLTPLDLQKIQKKMKDLKKQHLEFKYYDLPIDEAIAHMRKQGWTYKVEMAEDLKKTGTTTISFYQNLNKEGDVKFEDMCEGPHLNNMNEIAAFELVKLAGAYWRGDEKNKMLQRVYGYCFETEEELEAYKNMMIEAEKRDHRKLGKELKLFTTSDLIGAGLPLMQPRGMIIRRAIEDYLWELHQGYGYQRVWTPHIAKEALYETSGHAAKFGDELFRVQGKEDKFIMKPMNCPHHMQIFADNQFSYRDMPVRYFEPATVYRDEKSGQLGGLTRVRAITQDDGHLFCRSSQILDEAKVIVSVIKKFFSTMGMIDGYWVRLSLRGDDKSKYLGSDEVWHAAEGALKEVCESENLPYREAKDEAAFYGPKLDFMFKDAIGREWQLSTIQCDFNLPVRFDLAFINEKGEREAPVVIHRAISGSLERFMGVMIEHFAGAFPLWLAPEQVRIIPVSEKFNEYAQNLEKTLLKEHIRVSLDDSNESLGKRIRNAELFKIPRIVVVGEQEVNDNTVAVRNYFTKAQETLSVEAFVKVLQEYIAQKTIESAK